MQQDDLNFRAGFSRVQNGVLAAELAAMTDDELATWQAGWKPGVANHILASQEWQRRMLAHEFGLNRQLAEYAAKWQRFAAYIGVLGTVVGAVAGVVATAYSQAPLTVAATTTANSSVLSPSPPNR